MTTSVKICGLRTEAALEAAISGGADMFGLVFHAASPRAVDFETAARLAEMGRASGRIRSVALLVDPDDAAVDEVMLRVQPDMLQLHGRESVERVRAVRRRAQRPVMKAVNVATVADVLTAMVYRDTGPSADLILFDARPPAGRRPAPPGGNGLAFDWRILEAVKGRFAFGLAGGLNPDNVAAAIELTGAQLVDVSSGVERAPGEKDPELIHRFLRAAKTAKQIA